MKTKKQLDLCLKIVALGQQPAPISKDIKRLV
jgi:hypothetical protein